MKTIVASPKAPAAVGTYSQAVIADNTIYASGQLPIDPATGEFVPGGFKEQLTQVFTNLKNVLEEGGFKIIEQWQNNNPEYWSRYNGEQYTGDADTVWMDLEVLGGWKKFSWNEIKDNLKRGDILCSQGHIAFYTGEGKTVEARGVNNPKNKGHYETGDQGGEIDIYEAQGRNWTEVYRYVGK